MWRVYGLAAILTLMMGGISEIGIAQSGQVRLEHPASSLRMKQARQQNTCPTEVEPLTALLVRDLPSYANRQIRSAIPLDRTLKRTSVVIIAGRPEFEPLPLAPGQPAPSRSSDPAQVFISTLERQYLNDRPLETQQYHWLFLTRSTNGWRLAIMFTRTGSITPGVAPTPPRDSSNGAIAQAIKRWLRDCRAGLIHQVSE